MRHILALHCKLASSRQWQGLIHEMPEVICHCPDLPGHGDAPDWDAVTDYQTQALDLVMAQVPDGIFDIVGHSFGGTLALRILVEHPGRVRSVVLIEPVMFAAADPVLLTAHWAQMIRFQAAIDSGDLHDAARTFHAIWGDGHAFDELPERARDYMTHRIRLIPAAQPSIVADVHTILPRLPQGTPPVLMVTRNGPPEIVDSIAKGLVDRMPQAETARLGRGHMIPSTDTEGLAKMLRQFWRKAAA